MSEEVQRKIEENMKTSGSQQKLNAVAAVVQQVVDENGRAGHVPDANLLLEAYRRWQNRALTLFRQHWPNKKFHQWPTYGSSSFCSDLYELRQELEGVGNDAAAMAALLVGGMFDLSSFCDVQYLTARTTSPPLVII